MSASALRSEQDALVARACRGDRVAFEALYHAFSGRVHAICVRMTADARLAEELTQRSFVRAWQKLGTFRGEAAFGSWLHRLTVNVVLEHRRSEARRVVRLVSEPPDPPDPRRPSDGMDLERAIAGLPEGARHVFVLHDVEGWPHDEIAAALGVTTGTSKSQLHRARALLREALRR